MADATDRAFDLRGAFLAKQEELLARLRVTAAFSDHGTTIGDSSEADWVGMLAAFLPGRYGVAGGIVVDSTGGQSEQIDVLIYDKHYSPLFLKTSAGTLIVPAESVYAVFEVKQEINKPLAEYAGKKVASVRNLERTSLGAMYAAGQYPPREPSSFPILGGILATRSGWVNIEGDAATAALASLEGDRAFDLGCALDARSFEFTHPGRALEYSDSETQLIFFLLRLFRRLQTLGTVLVVDIDAYESRLAE